MARAESGPWSGSISGAWDRNAEARIRWAREPGHDSYWRFHRDQFLELLPPSPASVLDLGCGEGRLSRDLAKLGYRTTGIDSSRRLVGAAVEADPGGSYLVADAADLPFPDASFDLVCAFMSLQDTDRLEEALRGSARVLRANGRLCLAVVHPINSGGQPGGPDADSPFQIVEPYLLGRACYDRMVRGGLEMTFVSRHLPLQGYLQALEGAGLVVERLREAGVPPSAVRVSSDQRWVSLPLFLHLRARRG